MDSQEVKCWGRNNRRQLGLGLGTSVRIGSTHGQMGDDLNVVNLGGALALSIKVFPGGESNCVILDINENIGLKCWGSGSYGLLGQGITSDIGSTVDQIANLSPVDLGTAMTPLEVALGRHHACSVLNNGRVKCWGYNEYGQLGLGDVDTRGEVPGQMGDDLPYVDLDL